MRGKGDTIGGCTILAECGQGAFGHVYLALDALGHRVAVKHLATAAGGEYELKGLRNYISLVRHSPALVQIFLCGVEDGLPFYVMEAADNAAADLDHYLPDTLALRLKRQGRLPAAEALRICLLLLDGLEAMHDSGLLHRDIKPENVIFVDGAPKLADPGLTRNLEQTISVAGTPGYIAPEFFSGTAPPSPSSDIYAFGKLLYHCATGLPPADFPQLPDDLPVDELYQLLRPVLRLCHHDPARRCRSCAECREVLPRAIVRHGPLRRLRDAICVRPAVRRRALAVLAVVLATLAALAAVAAALAARRAAEKQADAAKRAAADAELAPRLAAAEAELPALSLQFQTLELPLDADALPRIRRLAADDPVAAQAAFDRRERALAETALRQIPSGGGGRADFEECAQGWGFLASPLGRHLPPEERKALRQRLTSASRAVADGGLALGEDYLASDTAITFISPPSDFAFVAPGWFRSPLLKAPRRLAYPFWILRTELNGGQFSELRHLRLRRNLPAQAAEFLAWNEALLWCFGADKKLRNNISLPPGYGIRPPTEEEWEFAALGGWLGIPPPQRPIPKDAACAAPTTAPPNALGLRGVDENVSEITLPYPERATDPPGVLVARGANYRRRTTGILLRLDYIPDQIVMPGGGGLRPVIAPIAQDFWETQWFRGYPIRHATVDSAVFAGFAVCNAVISWTDARQLAQDLGAVLPDDQALPRLDAIFTALHLPCTFPCPLDLHAEGGQWRRLADGALASIPSSPAPTKTKTCLAASPKHILAFAPDASLPTLLLQWADEAAFQRRREAFLRNAAVHTFEAEGRRHAVCRVRLPGYMVCRFAEFLGLSLPHFDSDDAVRSLAAQIPADLPAVAIGGSRFYDRWEQADRTPFPSNALPTLIHAFTDPNASDLHHALAIVNHSLGEVSYVTHILVTLP